MMFRGSLRSTWDSDSVARSYWPVGSSYQHARRIAGPVATAGPRGTSANPSAAALQSQSANACAAASTAMLSGQVRSSATARVAADLMPQTDFQARMIAPQNTEHPCGRDTRPCWSKCLVLAKRGLEASHGIFHVPGNHPAHQELPFRPEPVCSRLVLIPLCCLLSAPLGKGGGDLRRQLGSSRLCHNRRCGGEMKHRRTCPKAGTTLSRGRDQLNSPRCMQVDSALDHVIGIKACAKGANIQGFPGHAFSGYPRHHEEIPPPAPAAVPIRKECGWQSPPPPHSKDRCGAAGWRSWGAAGSECRGPG